MRRQDRRKEKEGERAQCRRKHGQGLGHRRNLRTVRKRQHAGGIKC